MRRFSAILSGVCALLLAFGSVAFCQEDDFEFDDNADVATNPNNTRGSNGEVVVVVDEAKLKEFDQLFEELKTDRLSRFAATTKKSSIEEEGSVFEPNEDGSGLLFVGTYSDSAEIVVPDKVGDKPVVGLDNLSFAAKEKLKKVVLPESLRTLGDGVFLGCENLEEVSIPAGVVEIGGGLFDRCPNVKLEGTFDANPVFAGIDLSAVDANPDARGFLWYERKDDHISIRGYVGGPRELKIPEKLDGKPATEIGNLAFSGCKTLESVIFPKTLTSIDKAAFFGCATLKSAPLPESAKEIGAAAFNACFALDSEEAFRAPARFGGASAAKVFGKPGMLGSLWYEIDGDEITIRECATTAVSLEIPREIDGRRVVALGDGAFCANPYLASITIPEGVKTVDANCFRECKFLTRVVLPSTVATIGEYAFAGCSNLDVLTIPENVDSIGRSAFLECDSLNLINAFKKCKRFAAKPLYEFCPDGVSANGFLWYEKRDDGIAVRGSIFGRSDTALIQIPDVVDGLPVVEIGDAAFLNALMISKLALPDTVARIGDDAFRNCLGLSQLRLPKNLTTLGRNAFSNGRWLKSVVLPSEIAEFAPSAFDETVALYAQQNCATSEKLKENGYRESDALEQEDDFDFDENAETGGNPNFKISSDGAKVEITIDKRKLEEFERRLKSSTASRLSKFSKPAEQKGTIQEGESVYGLDKDGSGVFFYGTSSDSAEIVVPDKVGDRPVVGLGNVSLASKEKLKKAVLPESLRTMGGHIFLGSEKLEEVAIPAGVVEIEGGLFDRCPKVKLEGTFDANPVFAGIDLSAVDANPDARGFLWYERKDDHISIRGYVGGPRELKIPEELDGKPVTEIGEHAFSNCHTLKSVVFPKTLKSIGEEAFQGCASLKSAPLPASTEEIGTAAFSMCFALDAEEAFRAPAQFGGVSAAKVFGKPDVIGMLWYEIDGDEITIRDCATSAVSLDVPSEIDGRRVVALGDYAFFLSPDLASITIPEGVTSVGAFCFRQCMSLTKVNLPSTVKTLGQQAFAFSPRLEILTIPESVESIGRAAFIQCNRLNLINAFRKNERFGGMRLFEFSADGASADGYAWYEKKDDGVAIRGYVGGRAPKKMFIPDFIERIPVVEIGADAFNLTPALEELALPDTVARIDHSAFDFCQALKRVHFPRNLKTLEEDAFANSPLIKPIVLPRGIVELGPDAFHQDVVLRAPHDCATAKTLVENGYQESR